MYGRLSRTPGLEIERGAQATPEMSRGRAPVLLVSQMAHAARMEANEDSLRSPRRGRFRFETRQGMESQDKLLPLGNKGDELHWATAGSTN